MVRNPYEDDIVISWPELHRDARYLSLLLHEKAVRWKGIIAITRGGLIPAALVARELGYASPEADRVLRRHFDPLAHAFITALQGALPHATHGDIAWTYQFALGALLHHMSDNRVQRLSHGANTPNDPASHPMLVRFIEAGIRAAVPGAPARQRPSAARPSTPPTHRRRP